MMAHGKERLYLYVYGPSTIRQVGDTGSVYFAQKAVIDLRKLGDMGIQQGRL